MLTARVNEIIANDESVTPNGLYVGVATLAGLVFTRHRAFPIRWITPPVVFVAALSYWMPHTAANLGNFYEQIEAAHFPQVTEQRVSLTDALKKYYTCTVNKAGELASTTRSQVASSLVDVEKTTGLRLGTVAPAPAPAPAKYEAKKLV